MLGPEIPVNLASNDSSTDSSGGVTFVEALRRELARELEDDNRRACGKTLAVMAQQYEDTEGFGPSSPGYGREFLQVS